MPSIVSPIASITASRDSNPRGLAHFQNSVQETSSRRGSSSVGSGTGCNPPRGWAGRTGCRGRTITGGPICPDLPASGAGLGDVARGGSGAGEDVRGNSVTGVTGFGSAAVSSDIGVGLIIGSGRMTGASPTGRPGAFSGTAGAMYPKLSIARTNPRSSASSMPGATPCPVAVGPSGDSTATRTAISASSDGSACVTIRAWGNCSRSHCKATIAAARDSPGPKYLVVESLIGGALVLNHEVGNHRQLCFYEYSQRTKSGSMP